MNAAEENVIQLQGGDSQSKPDQSVASGQELPTQGNLDKVRDILFGAQMRDYDRKFVKLEERLLKEAADVRDETRRRFESLENFIKQEINSLSERLKVENQQRTASSEEITRELRDTVKAIGQKIGQLDEQNTQSNRELREQILAQSKELSEEIRRKHEEMSSALARESRELRTDKADRLALSNLFTELALRLNNEFRLPGEE